MSVCIVTNSDLETPFHGKFGMVCWSEFNYAASGDTVKVPVGCQSVAVLPVSGATAPTTSISAGASEDTITLTGGTTGTGLLLVSRHGGNPAGAR